MAGYSGDAVDAITTPPTPDWVSNGRMFTTMDDENDTWPGGNCAIYAAGGWWFGECSSCEVNRDGNGIWQSNVATYDVQASRMLVKLN